MQTRAARTARKINALETILEGTIREGKAPAAPGASVCRTLGRGESPSELEEAFAIGRGQGPENREQELFLLVRDRVRRLQERGRADPHYAGDLLEIGDATTALGCLFSSEPAGIVAQRCRDILGGETEPFPPLTDAVRGRRKTFRRTPHAGECRRTGRNCLKLVWN